MPRRDMTIKATDEVQKLAEKAMAIQDACNPLPVANFLIECQQHFRNNNGQEHWGSCMGLQNPISLAVLNKLNSLARLEQTRTDCFSACMDLQNGRDVPWYIDALV